MITIKKYPNRRLYDTNTSKYITIKDLVPYIVDGKDFQIVCTDTRKHLTQSVLMELLILLDIKLPIEFLREQVLIHDAKNKRSYKLAQMLGNFNIQEDK